VLINSHPIAGKGFDHWQRKLEAESNRIWMLETPA